jgi:hypothetical protein
MPTGPYHYLEAERLLAKARTSTDHFYGEQEAIPTLLAAIAHALLGLTAATGTSSADDAKGWTEAAGTTLRNPPPRPPRTTPWPGQ